MPLLCQHSMMAMQVLADTFYGTRPKHKFVRANRRWNKVKDAERAKFKALACRCPTNPWDRLDNHWTACSAPKTVFFTQPRPHDYLDFALMSSYSQTEDLFVPKQQFSIQPVTLGLPREGMICNKELPKPPPIPEPPFSHPMRHAPPCPKKSPHSIKLAIESHHSSLTNRGYSRKPDGGFFIT